MHPADNVAIEYGKLVRERDDLDKKLKESEPHIARRKEIEEKLVELRQKMGEALGQAAETPQV